MLFRWLLVKAFCNVSIIGPWLDLIINHRITLIMIIFALTFFIIFSVATDFGHTHQFIPSQSWLQLSTLLSLILFSIITKGQIIIIQLTLDIKLVQLIVHRIVWFLDYYFYFKIYLIRMDSLMTAYELIVNVCASLTTYTKIVFKKLYIKICCLIDLSVFLHLKFTILRWISYKFIFNSILNYESNQIQKLIV